MAYLQARVCDMKPQTLEHDRYTGEVQPGSDEKPLKRFLLQLGGYYSRESRLMRGDQPSQTIDFLRPQKLLLAGSVFTDPAVEVSQMLTSSASPRRLQGLVSEHSRDVRGSKAQRR